MSKNNTRTCWVLKCDIRKFFANIDHGILLEILKNYIPDKDILRLLEEVVGSFSSKNLVQQGSPTTDSGTINNIGLPLGNLTSQLLVNIYMNEFDQFIKHKLKVKQYVRYADDFVIFSENRNMLENYVPNVHDFLYRELKLELHPQKLFFKTLATGVDFLGWVHFPDHRVLRVATKRRLARRLEANSPATSLQSYLGFLKHGNAFNISQQVLNYYSEALQ